MMDAIIQPRGPRIYINETNAHTNAVSVIVGTKIFFIDKESIPEFKGNLDKYMKTPRL